ncbi:MAG: extracellular solute-binding protein, partial [Verrucomicrobiota bacterium]
MNRLKLALLGLVTWSIAAPLHAEEITLYSHRHYPSDDALFKRFTEKTGINVNVVKAKADELIERLKAEGENTPADIFMTADAGRLERAKAGGLLKAAPSTTLQSRIPSTFRDPDDTWFGFTKRARIIAYAKDRVKPSELSTYEDLMEKKWKGRILVRSSSNIYNQSLMASMIAAHGEQKATEWAGKIRNNMARAPQGSDRDQMRAVAAGLGDVALVNTYYVGLLLNSSSAK